MLSSIILVIFKKVMTMMWEETSIHNFFFLGQKIDGDRLIFLFFRWEWNWSFENNSKSDDEL